jgi:hypothetical protein
MKGTSRCEQHQGSWSAYEVAKRKKAATQSTAKRKR